MHELRKDPTFMEVYMEKKKLLRIVFALIVSTSFLLTSCMRNAVVSNPTLDSSPTSALNSSNAQNSTPTPQPTRKPPPATSIVCPNTDLTQNSPDGPILIYSWNPNFSELFADTYAMVQPNFNYECQDTELSARTYQGALDSSLASGDWAPDLFTLEADMSSKYVNSEYTLDIAELGIDYAELYNQFPYTNELMTSESGQIKALTWESNPGVIYYNRTLADQYLGVSNPEDVQPYFADWDTFLSTARQIAADSNGTVRIISGTDDIYKSFSQQRSQGWVDDGEIYLDQIMIDLFDFAKILNDDELTFDTEQWSEGWTANKSNESVLAYLGPSWLPTYAMGFDYEEDGVTLKPGANPTSGDWACVAAPTPYFWGGIYLAASTYNNEKEISGDILRYFTIDTDSMKSCLSTNHGYPTNDYGTTNYTLFPNNIDLCISLATDNTIGFPYLGGQNPYPLYLDTALSIDVPKEYPFEILYERIYLSTMQKYIDGEYASVKEATQAFEDECNKIIIGIE
jgi:multiple sugar transport system substrate-binding protein